MPDFMDPADFNRLTAAVEWSEKKLGEFRKDRMDALREYVGFHYGENGSDDKRPINGMQICATVYHRKIRIKNPKGLVTTKYDELVSNAEDYRLALNQVIKDVRLGDAANEAGLDAMFACGMCEVGLDADSGEVFVEPILFEDVILDLSATNDREVGFVGHRYRAPLEWVKSNPAFDETRKTAAPQENTYGMGSESSDEKSQTLSVGTGRVEEYKEHVELVQLYLPKEGLLVTYLSESPQKPLSVVKWKGPPNALWGPYHKLAFVTVPGNVMPIGPAQAWRDVNESLNVIGVKTLRQAERQKTITLIPGENDEDGQRMVDEADGGAIGVSADPDKIKEKRFGGADQINLGAVMWLKQLLFGDVSGGVGMLAGMSAQTDTVGQDAMLLQSAGSQVEEMQSIMLEFVKGMIEDIAWWIFTDPIGAVDISRPIPGLDRQVTYQWDAKRRAGEFFQYNFDVEPYSIAPTTPAQRLNKVLALWERVAIPAIQNSGGAMQLDWEAMMKLVADYSDTPEFGRLFVYPSGEMHPDKQPQTGGSRVRGSQSGKPKGNYTRTSKTSPQRVEADMMGKLLSAGGSSREGGY